MMEIQIEEMEDHKKNGSYKWQQPEGMNDCIGMGTADLDFHCPSCVKEACLQVAEENTYNYRAKPEEYFQTVIGWYKRKYNCRIEKEWLFNVPSTIGAIRVALGAMTEPGDAVLVQTPDFAPLTWAIEGADCKRLENPLRYNDGKYEIDYEDFEQKIIQYHPSVFLLVNPHNPMGKVFTREELERMVEICDRHQVKIISDEVHSLITYEEHYHLPILAVSEKARKLSVQIVSMSKGFNLMSLPHAIVCIADEKLRNQYEKQVIPYSFHYATNSFSIAAVTSVMSGQTDDWLREVTAYLKQNVQDTITGFAEALPQAKVIEPEGGYLIWIDLSAYERPGEGWSRFFLEKTHISLNDGAEFGASYDTFIRINIGLSRQVLGEALARIKNVARTIKTVS